MWLDIATKGLSIVGSQLGGGPRKNSAHSNLTDPDPLVWHDGKPFDGSLDKSVNIVKYNKVKASVKAVNPELHDAFEGFKSANKRDPRKSEYNAQFGHLLKTSDKKKIQTLTKKTQEEIEKVAEAKEEGGFKAGVEDTKLWIQENKLLSLVIAVVAIGLSFGSKIKGLFGIGKVVRAIR